MIDDKMKKIEEEHQSITIKYLEKVKNADMTKYDMQFVNLYREGSVILNGNIIELEDLFLEFGKDNNVEAIMLVDFGTPNLDQVTLKAKENFEREDLMLFRNALSFYEIYVLLKEKIQDNTVNIDSLNKEVIKEIIYKNNNKQHDKVPETYYLEHDN